MKIYVVTKGEYSYYHIEAVFTDLKKAELFCGTFGHGEYDTIPEIEEYDSDKVQIEGTVYRAIKFVGRQNLYNKHYTMCDYYEIEIIRDLKPIKKEFVQDQYGDHFKFTFTIPVNKYIANKKEAEKIAEDIWEKFIAERENL